MSYRTRRNEARHRQLALLYTLASITVLLALGYYFEDLAEVGEWLQSWIAPEAAPEAPTSPLVGL